ncbi:hypothetical protein C1Y40_01364 [Mycobacterium talmoniae]|uniref:Uncharacterized protein n=1 Tax=Mycobacterium talmoniae TaxID=1858794 RepID=A0A2S8BP81_9MYCO|nr:hypothetical protein C1Y40_01364 [Mycobacterium talmoniae]
MPPTATLCGAASLRRCGSAAATRVNTTHTWSGGSLTANTVSTEISCAPLGRLRFVKDAADSTEFGMICRPLPVRTWVARQLTSTTRPRADGVSIQSPSWNGCSNSTNNPEMIWPTEFCSVSPSTIEVMPSAVNSPPTSAPQTRDRITASPTAISTNRATSRKIDGIRRRQLPSGAAWNRVALNPDSTRISTAKPNTVATMRTGVASADTWLALTSSASSAPSGSR